MLKKKAILLL